MSPDPPIEGRPEKAPDRKKGSQIQTLMMGVLVVSLGLGWNIHMGRRSQALGANEAVFNFWLDGFRRANPTLRPLGNSRKDSTSFIETSRRRSYQFQTPARETLTIEAVLRSGPNWVDHRVTFESSGQVVTWPFSDVERGRKVDLRAEFPGSFR